jgi:hypothetical protein
MKKIIIFISLALSYSCYALEKVQNTIESSLDLKTELSPSSNGVPSNFSIKEILSSPIKLEAFLIQNIGIITPSSADEIAQVIKDSTKNLFIKNYTAETPLISEFLFQSLKKPEAIAKFITIFVMVNQLIIFALVIIFSIVFSHYLGELKYRFPPLSLKRISYGIFRFSLVNGLRLWIFSFLFMENIKPISHVYLASVMTLKESYPALYTISSLVLESV